VALTPSGTASARREKIHRLKTAGLARLAVSLDGSTAAIHDAFRRVRGSYAWTMRILDDARDAGLSLQINTTVTRHNRTDLPALAERLATMEIVLWSVFFLVPTGRGRAEDGVSAQDYEEVLNDLYDLSSAVPFGIKTTEAPHYRRVVQERGRAVRRDGRTDGNPSIAALLGKVRQSPDQTRRPEQFGFRMDTIGRASVGVNDGKGFVFVDHVGDITPSGFLPLRAGNVRTDSLIEVYRGHPLFRALRSPDGFRGRCGRCEYRATCGGSRARAYAMTGDYLGEDPCCLYEPTGGAESV
jgi:radical SAM protein with 4Fe4S-binding SPASM domain